MWEVFRKEVYFYQPFFWIRILPDYFLICQCVPECISWIVPDYVLGGQVEKVVGDWRCIVLG
jgi:hypothetical protein